MRNTRHHLYCLLAFVLFCHAGIAQPVQHKKTVIILPRQTHSIPASINNADTLILKGKKIEGKNKADTVAELTFDLGMLPEGAEVVSLSLLVAKPAGRAAKVKLGYLSDANRFRLNETDLSLLTDSSEIVSVQTKRSKTISTDEFFIKGLGQPLVKKVIDAANKRKGISLYLYVNEGVTALYSDKATNINNRPRLCVEYLVGKHFASDDWPQPYANAQHSGQEANLASYSAGIHFSMNNLASGSSDYYFAGQPLYADNQLILPVLYTAGTPHTYLQAYAVDHTARLVAKSAALRGGGLLFPLSADSRGRIICIDKQDSIRVLDLAKGLADVSVVPDVNPNKSPVQQITAMPTVGADGSIYVPTLNGLLAFTADYQLKWTLSLKTDYGNHFSTPSLSADEKKLYVFSGDNGELITVDNANGDTLKCSKAFQGISYIRTTHDAKLPVPIVDAVSGKVIILDNGKLFFFNEDGKPVHGSNQTKVDTLYGQPKVADGKLYVVYGDRVEKFDLEGKRNFVRFEKKSNHISGANEYLTELAMSANGTLYTLNTGPADRNITVLDTALHILAKQGLPSDLFSATAVNAEKNLVSDRFSVAPGENLFTANKNNILWFGPDSMKVITPQNFEKPFSGREAFSAVKDVHIPETVLKGSDIIINQHNHAVYFPQRFKMDRGSQIKISNGMITNFIIDTAGNVGIATGKPRAAMDLYNISDSFVIPGVDQQTITNFDNPVEGLMFYNKTSKRVVFYNGARWLNIDGSKMYDRVGDIAENTQVISNINGGQSEFGDINTFIAANPGLKNPENRSKRAAPNPLRASAETSFTLDIAGKIGVLIDEPKADLDMRNTKTGLLLPAATQQLTANGYQGLEGGLIYDTQKKQISYFNGESWMFQDGAQIVMPGAAAKQLDRRQNNILKIGSDGKNVVYKYKTVSGLDLSLGNRGLLSSCITEAEMRDIRTPTAGTLVYNLSNHSLMIFDGNNWASTFSAANQRNKWQPMNIDSLQYVTSDAIVDIPDPKDGYTVYNTTAGKLVQFSSGSWRYTNKRKMDYAVGDTVGTDGAIVFWLNDARTQHGRTVASHGLIVKPQVFQNVFFPFEFGFSGSGLTATSEGQGTGEQNTRALWDNKASTLPVTNIYKYEWTTGLIWKDHHWMLREETYGPDLSPGEISNKYEDFVKKNTNHETTNLGGILWKENVHSGPVIPKFKWYVPSLDELKLLRTASWSNTDKFTFLANLSGGKSFISSSRQVNPVKSSTKRIMLNGLLKENTQAIMIKNVWQADYFLLYIPFNRAELDTRNHADGVLKFQAQDLDITEIASKLNLVLISDF